MAEHDHDNEATLTLFEFGDGGHYPNFMRLCLDYWHAHPRGVLRAIVTRRFAEKHPEVFAGYPNGPGSTVRWATLDSDDEDILQGARDFANYGPVKGPPPAYSSLSAGWKLVNKYAARFPARHILAMNLDELLFPLGAGLPAPSDLSGVLFFPAFYYRKAERSIPFNWLAHYAFQERIVRERLVNHPQLKVAFFLDADLAERLKGTGTVRVQHLIDPVRVPEHEPSEEDRRAIRVRLGVPPDRHLYLFFGDFRTQKGTWRLMEALRGLKPEEASRICLAIVGHARDTIEERMSREVADLVATTPLTVIRRKGYVPDAEVNDWFDAANVVLAPYIRHPGSSGVLMLAAAHGVPAISQEYGLMGRMTRENRLGITVDPNDIAALTAALRQFLDPEPPAGFDRETARAFARRNSAELFGEQLFGALDPYLKAASGRQVSTQLSAESA